MTDGGQLGVRVRMAMAYQTMMILFVSMLMNVLLEVTNVTLKRDHFHIVLTLLVSFGLMSDPYKFSIKALIHVNVTMDIT